LWGIWCTQLQAPQNLSREVDGHENFFENFLLSSAIEMSFQSVFIKFPIKQELSLFTTILDFCLRKDKKKPIKDIIHILEEIHNANLETHLQDLCAGLMGFFKTTTFLNQQYDSLEEQIKHVQPMTSFTDYNTKVSQKFIATYAQLVASSQIIQLRYEQRLLLSMQLLQKHFRISTDFQLPEVRDGAGNFGRNSMSYRDSQTLQQVTMGRGNDELQKACNISDLIRQYHNAERHIYQLQNELKNRQHSRREFLNKTVKDVKDLIKQEFDALTNKMERLDKQISQYINTHLQHQEDFTAIASVETGKIDNLTNAWYLLQILEDSRVKLKNLQILPKHIFDKNATSKINNLLAAHDIFRGKILDFEINAFLDQLKAKKVIDIDVIQA